MHYLNINIFRKYSFLFVFRSLDHSCTKSSSMKNHIKEHDSSPWEMSTQTTKESSPWELAPQHCNNGPRYDVDEDSPAGAYGAYSVRPKRRQVSREYLYNESPPQPQLPSNQNSNAKERVASPPVRSPSPENLDFRKPNSTYKSRNSFKSSPSLSSVSSSSSRKSTPSRVRPNEAASKEETSSLLNSKDSDDEPEEKSHRSPGRQKKVYELEKNRDVSEQTMSLTQGDTDSNCGDSQIDLEWDPTLLTDSSVPSESLSTAGEDETSYKSKVKKCSNDKLQKVLASLDGDTIEKGNEPSVPPDLLLSYNEVQNSNEPKSNLDILEELFNANQIDEGEMKDEVRRLQELLPSPKHQQKSEVVHNPILESFFESPPPPPQEFASREKVLTPVPVDSSRESTPSHQPNSVSETPTCQTSSDGVKATSTQNNETEVFGNGKETVDVHSDGDEPLDESVVEDPVIFSGQQESAEVLVVDTDELTDLKLLNRRRKSFDQAQEYGNVLSD